MAEGASDSQEASALAGAELRRLHPATFLLDIVRLGRAMILPLIIVFFMKRGNPEDSGLFWVVLVASSLGLFGSISRYMTVRYGVVGGRLIIKSGIFVRSQLTIPVDKIQNLNHESGPLHRMLGVVEVRVETAGSGGAEASLSVLSRADAEILRHELLAARKEVAVDAPEPFLLRRSTPSEILLAGATETRIGLLLAAVWMVYEVATQVGEDEASIAGFLSETFSDVNLPVWAAATASLLGALMFGWVASILTTLLSDFGFELNRVGRDLKKSHGLLTKVETTVPIPRVQGLALDANLPRIALGWRRVRVETAGSARDAQSGGTSTLAPLIPFGEVAAFCRVVFPDLDLGRIPLERVHPLALRRGFSRAFLFGAMPIGALALIDQDTVWLYGLLALVPIAMLWSKIRYDVLGYASWGRFLVVRSGVIRQRLAIVPKEKVQTVAVRRSPIQRLLGLASLHLSTAGSGTLAHLVVPDLGLEEAGSFFEHLTHEASRGGAL